MQDFAQRKGVALAPHGKTTMSPELFRQQLAGGAWGLTFATIFQLAVGVEAGARRAIIANQVLCDADLDGLDMLLAEPCDLRVWFLVDSLAQLAMIEDWARRRQCKRRLDTLLEIGMPGQRTGCRTLEEALALARAIARSPACSSAASSATRAGWRAATASTTRARSRRWCTAWSRRRAPATPRTCFATTA